VPKCVIALIEKSNYWASVGRSASVALRRRRSRPMYATYSGQA